jgi:hypothetical protein
VRHVRMLGLCLVVALAVGAYLTSSAMAGPQWVQCKSASELEAVGYPFEAKQVKYVNKDCTEKSPKEARAYVLLKAPEVENLRLNYLEKETANVPFSGESVGGGGVLTSGYVECQQEGNPGGELAKRWPRGQCEAEGGEVVEDSEGFLFVECSKENNTGEAEGKNKVANVHVTFKGCKALGFIPCIGVEEGLEEGEIRTHTLKGKLGYIEPEGKAKHEAGVVLEPATKKGPFADFTCFKGGQIWSVGAGNKKEGSFYTGPLGEEKHGGYDQVISPITPTNQMTSEFEQVYTVNPATTENIPNKLENKHISLLEDWEESSSGGGLMWSPAGEEITNVNVSEEAGEIKA